MTNEQRIETLERDVLRVKRQNRLLLSAAAIIAAGCSLWGVLRAGESSAYAQAGAVPVPIRASAFILEDATGKVRATLGMDLTGPHLSLVDQDGKLRATLDMDSLGLGDQDGKPRSILCADEEGAKLVLSDRAGVPRAVLHVDESESALMLWDARRKGNAMLDVGENGESGVSFAGEDDKTFVSLGVARPDTRVLPHLSLYDEHGKCRASLDVSSADGRPELRLGDASGETRARLLGSAAPGGTPQLHLLDQSGKIRALLGSTQITTPEGATVSYPESSLILFGPDGKVFWSAPRP